MQSSNKVAFNLTLYYIDLALMSSSSVKISHLLRATSSLLLANLALELNEPWVYEVSLPCKMDPRSLHECIFLLNSLVIGADDSPDTHNMIKEQSAARTPTDWNAARSCQKRSKNKYYSVSNIKHLVGLQG